jgi:membrane protein
MGWIWCLWAFTRALIAELSKDRVGLVAAGIAFYGLLSIFPAIAAILALSGLVTEPASIVEEMRQLGSVLPQEAQRIIVDQANKIAGSQDGGLGLTLIAGLAISIYSASKAVGALIAGIHVAAGEVDNRGFVASAVFNFAMTLLVILLASLAILSTIVVPTVISALGLTGWLALAIGLARWPILGIIVIYALGALYRLSLRNTRPRSAWVTPGAIVAVVLWLIGSVLYSIYVQNFADYNATFGTLGGVMSLLMWMWLSAYIVLFGQEVNALVASGSAVHQTRVPSRNASGTAPT